MVLVPRLTPTGPGQALMYLVAVAHKLIRDVLPWRHGVDVLCGDLADPPQDVVRRPRHRGDERAVADGRVRSREDEVVWELWTRNAEVAFGLGAPFLCKRCPIPPCYRVVWDVRDVEACGADDDVEIVVF